MREMRYQLKVSEVLLPMCAACKRVCDNSGHWHAIDEVLYRSLEANFTHTVCPDCANRIYPDHCEYMYDEFAEATEERAYGQDQDRVIPESFSR